jgi:hypothetical protein
LNESEQIELCDSTIREVEIIKIEIVKDPQKQMSEVNDRKSEDVSETYEFISASSVSYIGRLIKKKKGINTTTIT